MICGGIKKFTEGVKQFTTESNNSRRGLNNSRRCEIIRPGIKYFNEGVK